MTEKKLNEMKPGEGGLVKTFVSGQVVAARLREMGLVPGTRVRVERVAPFGDPIEIRLRGYLLSLRKQEAALVTVTTDKPAEIAAPQNGPAGSGRCRRRRMRLSFGRGRTGCPENRE